VAEPIADPEGWLSGLDKVGWKFGLERIELVCDELRRPQERFASIHVVGSNGKSSVAQMIAALLGEHGLTTGAYLSPHLDRWSARIRIHGAEIPHEEFALAVSRTAQAIEAAGPDLEPGERVTQFEAVTAAAFLALAEAKVEVGVIEAGLGGRLDATNVIPSRVTVLTSVSLEHTEYLGETEEEIAAEKLAVLKEGSTLVVGRVGESVLRLAEATARERSAELINVPDAGADVPESVVGTYQRRNFAVALAAAEAFRGTHLDGEAIEHVGAWTRLPARLEYVRGEPPLILDAAHNPEGVAAVVESLPELTRGRPVIAVLAALADKPATELCAPLASACEKVICTEIPPEALEGVGRPGARSHPAGELERACAEAGVSAEAIADAQAALARARELASAAHAIVLVLGSFYLLSAIRS
jgi:dihydrofolate synthase/folylpolyglutamate synthase